MSAQKICGNTSKKRKQCREQQASFFIICFVVIYLNGKIICKIIPFIIWNINIFFISLLTVVLITLGILSIVSLIIKSFSTGMMKLLAYVIAAVVGRFYAAAAVLIGSSGAFITGTGLGSNIMFAQMHIDAAASLGMNPITIFAGQNAGASLGNLICPTNTVAACATVDQVGNAGEVMKKTF